MRKSSNRRRQWRERGEGLVLTFLFSHTNVTVNSLLFLVFVLLCPEFVKVKRLMFRVRMGRLGRSDATEKV